MSAFKCAIKIKFSYCLNSYLILELDTSFLELIDNLLIIVALFNILQSKRFPLGFQKRVNNKWNIIIFLINNG